MQNSVRGEFSSKSDSKWQGRCPRHRTKGNRGENSGVPAKLMHWVWAGGRKFKGLQKRRKYEGMLCLATQGDELLAQTA